MIRTLCTLLICAYTLVAQTITGTITGTVKDSSGLALTGAEVKLIQPATGAERAMKTNERGDFVFGSVRPGTYTLRMAQIGFKTLIRENVVLSASETLASGEMKLEVG